MKHSTVTTVIFTVSDNDQPVTYHVIVWIMVLGAVIRMTQAKRSLDECAGLLKRGLLIDFSIVLRNTRNGNTKHTSGGGALNMLCFPFWTGQS
jgi:hypothetical protein